MISTCLLMSAMRMSLYWRGRISDLSSLVQKDTISYRLPKARNKLTLGNTSCARGNSGQKSSATHRSRCRSRKFAGDIIECGTPQFTKWRSIGPTCCLESPMCLEQSLPSRCFKTIASCSRYLHDLHLLEQVFIYLLIMWICSLAWVDRSLSKFRI